MRTGNISANMFTRTWPFCDWRYPIEKKTITTSDNSVSSIAPGILNGDIFRRMTCTAVIHIRKKVAHIAT